MASHDIIVVGAGPIGSTYACNMAEMGYDVALFDMKARIGQPLQCAGLVSTNINTVKDIPSEVILNRIRGANLYSPDNTSITVGKDEDVAYVLDRVYYDKYLFEKAVDAGVTPYISQRVYNVDIENTTVKLEDKTLNARLIAVACGPTSTTANKMNPEITPQSFTAIQYTINSNNSDTDFVNLKVNKSILPGFIWDIPVTANTRRVGLFTNTSYGQAEQVLNSTLSGDESIVEKHVGLIPRYNKKRIIAQNNTILIGDSAGQVKPTTGGGLIVGFNCTQMASTQSHKALEEEDNTYLQDYQTQYHQRYDKEFKLQQNVQKILEELSEDDFNYMFGQLRSNNVDKMISEYGDMDTQTPLIKQLVKTGLIFKLAPKIGVRRLKNIWKSQ